MAAKAAVAELLHLVPIGGAVEFELDVGEFGRHTVINVGKDKQFEQLSGYSNK
ncbi:hypothetical protein GCM10027037_17250 [Mucilaginibacter koreensis]